MKVLHLVSAPTLTGPADPALGLARGQQALGVDVTLGFDTQRSGTMAEKVAEAGVPTVPELVLSTKAGLGAMWRDRRWIHGHASGFDVVHVHTSHDHSLAVGIGKQTCLVRSIHHPRGCRRRGLQSYIYGRTTGFVLVAEQHRDLLLQAYPNLASEAAVVVPGAVDPIRFSPDADGSQIRTAMGFTEPRFVVGLVARIKPGRGHELILSALVKARETVPELGLALIGKGEGVPEVQAQIALMGLSGHVKMLGYRDADLAEAMRACDVTVLLNEGNDASCRAVLESLACGVPVLGAAHPAIADALDLAHGRLFQPGDEAGLVGLLVEAAQWSKAERESLSKRARAHVLAHHTDEVRAQAVLQAYQQWGIS